MKAFLLAAGKGTRLKPYTDEHPKCLIPIHGIPLLKIWIDLLAAHGVTEVLINTHHHADQVERFVGQARTDTPMAIHTVYEPQLRGSAGTIWENRGFVRDQSDFLIVYADNLTNLDLSQMIDKHRHFRAVGGVLTMGLIHAPDPRACGIVTLDRDKKIIKFVEKPAHPESDLANGGIYAASTAIYDAMRDSRQQRQGVWDFGHHVLPLLAGRMYGYHISPYYLQDIGTPEAYADALRHWQEMDSDKHAPHAHRAHHVK